MIPREEERRLVNRTKMGDQESFEKLEILSRRKVTLHMLKLLKNETETEEIYQRGLIRAWKKIKKFRGDCRFSTWLCKICHNLARDEFKKKSRKLLISYDQIIETNPNAEATFLRRRQEKTGYENLETQELGGRLNDTFDRLSTKHREILDMLIIQDMTYAAIASDLDISMGSVMSRIFHARKRAQKIYNQIERGEK